MSTTGSLFDSASSSRISLDDAIDAFTDLDRPSARRLDETTRFNAVLAAIHGLCVALGTCEREGVSRSELVSILRDVRRIHGRSPLISRMQHWPRGYPGDFETIEYLWAARNSAPDPLSACLEQYALTAPVAEQHRHKIRRQASLLREALANEGHRVVALACGSGVDLRLALEWMPDWRATEPGQVYLNDYDPAALDFCRAALGPRGNDVAFEAGHALRVLKRMTTHADLIMVGGLFDYLSERVCEAVVAAAFERLRPGGRLFFTNIATGNPYRLWMEYVGDWHLIERDEDDVRGFFQRIAGEVARVDVERDVSGLALLVTAERCG